MTIEIIDKGPNTGGVILKSSHPRFKERYTDSTECAKALMFKKMESIADWCNNVIGEECMFTIG